MPWQYIYRAICKIFKRSLNCNLGDSRNKFPLKLNCDGKIIGEMSPRIISVGKLEILPQCHLPRTGIARKTTMLSKLSMYSSKNRSKVIKKRCFSACTAFRLTESRGSMGSVGVIVFCTCLLVSVCENDVRCTHIMDKADFTSDLLMSSTLLREGQFNGRGPYQYIF